MLLTYLHLSFSPIAIWLMQGGLSFFLLSMFLLCSFHALSLLLLLTIFYPFLLWCFLFCNLWHSLLCYCYFMKSCFHWLFVVSLSLCFHQQEFTCFIVATELFALHYFPLLLFMRCKVFLSLLTFDVSSMFLEFILFVVAILWKTIFTRALLLFYWHFASIDRNSLASLSLTFLYFVFFPYCCSRGKRFVSYFCALHVYFLFVSFTFFIVICSCLFFFLLQFCYFLLFVCFLGVTNGVLVSNSISKV